MQADKVMQCPICLDTMTSPILLCKAGHSMCGVCISVNGITTCPQCRGPLTQTRNYQLEQLIEGVKKCMKLPCFFVDNGCKYILSSTEKDEHEAECKFRKFHCEGKKFANWKCEWMGNLADLHKHFKDYHNNHTWMEFRTAANMAISFDRDFYDVQIISFHNGQQYFFYKHKVDSAAQKAYWTFQFIGPKKQASNYFYEFEVHNGPIRKFKVTEICESDTVKAADIFNKEKCVVMDFKTIRNFLNDDGELPFKFRIMAVKKVPTGLS